MKREYSSREEIIAKADEIAKRDGISNLSMRKLSSECYLALGTLYHYFESKEELILALMENYWKEKFKESLSHQFFGINFLETFEEIYNVSKEAFIEFENLFIRRQVDGAKTLILKGKEKQRKFVDHLKMRLVSIARIDSNVNQNTFDEVFTLEKFVTTLFEELLTSLVNHEDKKEYLKALITRIMY